MNDIHKTIILLIFGLFLTSFIILEKEISNVEINKQDKLDLIISELKEIKELLK